eukprot:3424407-Amphidinium_carterae.1
MIPNYFLRLSKQQQVMQFLQSDNRSHFRNDIHRQIAIRLISTQYNVFESVTSLTPSTGGLQISLHGSGSPLLAKNPHQHGHGCK